ncbi:unnamed protein product, partial [Allacma fusca]
KPLVLSVKTKGKNFSYFRDHHTENGVIFYNHMDSIMQEANRDIENRSYTTSANVLGELTSTSNDA